MTGDSGYYRNKCIQLQAQLTAKDKAHADECTQFRAKIAQLEAKIEENQNTQIAALKGMVSALAAKNLGHQGQKKTIP